MITLKNAWDSLTSEQRRIAIVLLGLILVGLLLETLGVGLVVPTLALMTQSDLAMRYASTWSVVETLGHQSCAHLVVAGLAVVIVAHRRT
jgi:hypothetical protein